MVNTSVSQDIKYIGVNDHQIDLFEGQYEVPNGMAYNSYLILDEKIAVMDTVDANFVDKWLSNLDNNLSGREPDYLIVHHMEPDHSSNIKAFASAYPNAIIVATAQAFVMMKNFYGEDYESRRIIVKDGDNLSLGRHNLTFVTAPMVHWPEVMMSYEKEDKVLFSADAFGKFGALDHNEDWACEARRYYFGIVGKFGVQVQTVLKKLGSYEISTICPLHGPVLNENLSYYLNLYNTWSSYNAESEGVMIAYTTIYGNTKKAVQLLEKELKEQGCPKVVVCDLAREDEFEAIEDAFRYGKLVFASTSYNADVFPYMRHFLEHLTLRNFQNKSIAFIENGSWAPTAARIMNKIIENCKNLEVLGTVTIKSAMTEENKNQIKELAAKLV